MASPLKDALDGSRRAMSKVMEDVHRTTGKSNDPDVRAYSRLGTEDFERLTEQFGEESISRYVREMELRRQAHGR